MKSVKLLVVLAILAVLSVKSYGLRPPPMDPNDVPFAFDPNNFASDLLSYVVTDSNVSVISTIRAHNKGGWLTDLYIAMCDGSPTDSVIQRVTARPVKDPNGGWIQEFTWGWTPPGEGVYYLEFRLSTRGKPGWKGDVRTILVYAYGEDIPYLTIVDVPNLMVRRAQKLWQHAKKIDQPLTAPSRIFKRGVILKRI